MTNSSLSPEGESSAEELSPKELANAYLQRNIIETHTKLAGVEASMTRLTAEAPAVEKWFATTSNDPSLEPEDQQLIADMRELKANEPRELGEHMGVLDELLSMYEIMQDEVDQNDELTIANLSQRELEWREQQKAKKENNNQASGSLQAGE